MNNPPFPKNQSRKNWALFAVLLSVAVILFAVTIIRFGSAATAPAAPPAIVK